MITETNKNIIEKLKPELKKFNLEQKQIWAIGVLVMENPQRLQECIEYLKSIPTDIEGDDIVSSITSICYKG